jgi:GT2 family glycosyltransferase
LAALDYEPERFEVVVVDDGSTPLGPVERVVAEASGPLSARLIPQRHAGPAAARNTGVKHARFDLLAFTDDDCRPDPGWLRALAASCGQEESRVTGGRTVNALEEDLYATATQALVSYLTEESARRGRPFLASNNLALPRRLFDRVGGFDEGFPLAAGEDRDFCDRCIGAGCELVLAKDAVVHHFHAMTAPRFLRQHFHYGRGAFVYHEARLRRNGGGERFEGPGFYLRLVGYPLLRRARVRASLRVALLLAAAQVANAAGYLAERRRRAPKR